MANSRALIVMAILLVLAVVLFSAIYFTRRSSSDNSVTTEFSASADVTPSDGSLAYSIDLWTKITLEADNSIRNFYLEARVDYVAEGINYRHVYLNGNLFVGPLESDGFFNVSQCTPFSQDDIVNTNAKTFVPQEVTDPLVSVYPQLAECPGCKVYNLAIGGNIFLMFALPPADGKPPTPKILYSQYFSVAVKSFTLDQKILNADPNGDIFRAYSGLCVPESAYLLYPGPDTNDTITVSSAGPDLLAAIKAPPARSTMDLLREKEERFAVARKQAADTTQSSSKMGVQGCDQSMKGNGQCNDACNDGGNGYDDGDCCQATCKPGKFPCGPYYNCKAGGKRCVFLHGVGSTSPVGGVGEFNSAQQPGSFGSSFYFADFSQFAGACSSAEYARADTTNLGWRDTNLQNLFYDRCVSAYSDGGVVFAHSMANMILGGACLMQGKCACKWYDLSGPIRGSAAGDVAANIQWWTRPIFGNVLGAAYNQLARWTQGLQNAGADKDRLAFTIAKTNGGLLLGQVCGTDGWGAGGTAGAACLAAKTFVYGISYCTKRFWGICYSWAWVNADGVVSEDECAKYANINNGWKNEYLGGLSDGSNSRYYRFAGNHYDSTGRYGNHKGILDWMKRAALGQL